MYPKETLASTLIGLFMKNVSGLFNEIALRHKKYGIWQEITWGEYYKKVKTVFYALTELGLKPQDKVAFLSDNRPEWMYWEVGAMCARVIPFGIYADNTNLDEIHYLMNFSEAKLVLCEDQEQVDKIISIKKKLPLLKRIIFIEEKEVIEYTDPLLISYREFMNIGTILLNRKSDYFEKMLKEINKQDIAMFSLTSGTTAKPKLAMLSHDNLVCLTDIYEEIDPTDKDFDFISFLPTAWIGERMTSVARSLRTGFRINFPESPETALRDMREIGPSLIFSPPRLWQQMYTDIEIKIADSTILKRLIYKQCLKFATKIASKANDKLALSIWDRFFYAFADVIILRKLRDHLGLSRIIYLYTGGAAIGTDLFLFFLAIGVKIKQAYGLTESGAIAAIQRSDDIRLETVGPPGPGVTIKISDEGEILIKGRNVFRGYFNQPNETKKVLKEGWLYSGDKGYLDENNHLVMIDRFGDVMVLSDGREFSPQFIENKLKFSIYITECIIVGNGKDYVGALIQVNMDTVGKFLEDQGIVYTTYTDLARKKQVFDLIEKEVDLANQSLPDVAKIKRFSLLEKELDAEGGELTQSKKMRRAFVMEKYKKEIDRLYGD
ncbi:MAG: AMP-binding protein [Deltaproteobacteria bacterium]|nr:AMP-binding protein [Deltaproteobacteria bacterium]